MRDRREKVFSGKLLQVFRGKKKLPGGKDAYFEEIDHPGAAIVVPFKGNKIVMIRQYRAVIKKYIWELPAGTLEKGETSKSCAKREVIEETGYEVSGIKKIGSIYTTPGFCNERIDVFKAECGKEGNRALDPDELIQVKVIGCSEIRNMFKGGKISDSKTIAALSFAGVL